MLSHAGHDVLWARTGCPGSTDVELLNLAEAQGRIVLTLDKDFWQIALQRRMPLSAAGVVLFRIHPATPERIEPLVRALDGAGHQWRAHISVVAPNGIQMLPARRH
ncbi:MAG: DUF5615 family PIN-like protein [Acidobacteria bacterium]|nr:DUF5615 family PIN-like protein [Acidobacteriota bacterium]